MPSSYWYDPESNVEPIARQLIEAHHDHLEEARILFLFRDPAAKKGDRITLGTASLMTAKENAILTMGRKMAPYDFKIVLSHVDWMFADEPKRIALIDHELCHCTEVEDDKTGEKSFKLTGHDLEEFNVIVERHGLWKGDVEAFAEAICKQLEIPFPEPESL